MYSHAKHKPLSGDGLRRLIAKYNVVFEGPLPPQEWPLRYISVSTRIKEIRRSEFDEYGPSENRGLFAVTQLKRAVVEINDAAKRCRKITSNEYEWRTRTEFLIMSRFDDDLVW
jgi:hypothetical protein